MNLNKPKIQQVQVQAKEEKGFIEELTPKVKDLIKRFGTIPLNVQRILQQQYNLCQQQLLDIEDVAQLEQYIDPIYSQTCPNIWKIRLRATGNYDGKEFVGWLVFPSDYPECQPVFCLCYPKHNNMDKKDDFQKLAFQHENIYQSGEMSICALEKFGWDFYGPKLLQNIYQIIACIIGHPNPDAPANSFLVQNSQESRKFLIQYQLQFLNDYPSQKK